MGAPKKPLMTLYEREWFPKWKKSFHSDVVPGSLWTVRKQSREELEESEGMWPWVAVRWLKPEWQDLSLKEIIEQMKMIENLVYDDVIDLEIGDIFMVIEIFDHQFEGSDWLYKHARVLFDGKVGDMIFLKPEDWPRRLQRIM